MTSITKIRNRTNVLVEGIGNKTPVSTLIPHLFFSELVIWPSISTDLLVFHIEIQALVFDADAANGQKGPDVENR